MPKTRSVLNEHGKELNDFMSQLAEGHRFIAKNEPVLLRLKQRAEDLSAPDLKHEKVKSSQPCHAVFTADAEYIVDMEAQLKELPDMLEKLEKQVYDVIAQEPDARKRYVLSCKFLEGLSYGEIGETLVSNGHPMNRGSVYRWAIEALNEDLTMPKEPIWLNMKS